jgi:hypothetical protein
MPRVKKLRSGHLSQSRTDLLATVAVAVVIGGPSLFTANGFYTDYTNHLWLVWVQQHAISAHLAPTYFISAPKVGIFYPFFMFYGATLYAIAGGLAVIVGGHATVAYVSMSVAAIAAAYGGLLWLARQLGVRSWPAHAPALTYVTSAYYVSKIYGSGAWAEFIATSMIPLVAAAAFSLLRSPRIRLGPAILFVSSVILLTGSHNITLLLATVGFGLLVVALFCALGRDVIPAPGRLAFVAVLTIVSVGVNAWFLLPDVLHASDTAIAQQLTPWARTGEFNTISTLFDPLRSVPHGSPMPALFVQAPDWFLVWGVLATATVWSAIGRKLRRASVALAALFLLTLSPIVVQGDWQALPRIIREVQFAYRLDTYLALYAAGFVLVAAIAVQREGSRSHHRRLSEGLMVVTAISCGLCVWQLWIPQTRIANSYTNREAVFTSVHRTPRSWYDTSIDTDISARVVKTSRDFAFDPTAITSDHVTLRVDLPPGRAPTATNILAGPYAVTISGEAVRAGRTAGASTTALRRTSDASGPATVDIASAGGVLTTGQRISELSVALLLAGLAVGVARMWRRRGRSPV